jgi:hypothetical protein
MDATWRFEATLFQSLGDKVSVTHPDPARGLSRVALRVPPGCMSLMFLIKQNPAAAGAAVAAARLNRARAPPPSVSRPPSTGGLCAGGCGSWPGR